MREALTQALSEFTAGGPLRDRVEELFGVLGYRSKRTVDAEQVKEFIERLEANELLTERQHKLFASWRTAEIIFQVTDDEIAGQAGLFEGVEFDKGRIQSFLFVAVELTDGSYNRTHLAETTRAVNRRFAMPVIILFRHGSTLTLAVVHRRTHKQDSGRDVLEKVTLVKDIRVAGPHRAHIDILAALALPCLIEAGVRNFDGLHAAWERTLDIEELNRRFYRDLFHWFERAVEECRFPDDGAGPGNPERHVIRLITRLLFIWFLKEKGLVPDELFEEYFAEDALKQHGPERTDYYRAVLQNLFFATLNTEIDKRAFSKKTPDTHRDSNKYRYRSLLVNSDDFIGMLTSVPFVNGGLFDCLDDFMGAKAGGRSIDAFTDNISTQGRDLDVPARLFLDPDDGLFPLFRRYKFTVEENTPLDREVALDPELLGQVFENLLAAYNPETRLTARKATGSYYTPRHIVDYMVEEALAASLAEKSRPTDGDIDFWRERLRYLLDYADAGELFDPEETENVVRAIAGLRVLDPAVGSGAFPMAVLHKLTLGLRRLDPDNAHWEKLQKEQAGGRAGAAFDVKDDRARDEELLDISKTFEVYRESDFGRKLYLMQNGIFGVDIQPVACQIAKLRFFISLVVEQDTIDDPNQNFGIRPLPNLETRFVAANTLLSLGTKKQAVLGSDIVKATEDRLRRLRERYFNARTPETKLRLRNEDTTLRAKLARELKGLGFGHDKASAVAAWDPYDQNAHADWFDPGWMFGLSGGFDVVIGNPPYIRGEKIPGKAKLRAKFGDFYRGTADIFTYFFRKGVEGLRENGLLCFITSNKFMRAEYGEPLRVFLKQDAPPLFLLDVGRTGTFDATVRPSVLLARKSGRHETLRAATVRDRDGMTDAGAFMKRSGFDMPVADLADTGWSLAEPALLRLRARIETAGAPLRGYLNEGIYYGIKTGLNAAFVIDADTHNWLIAEDPNSAELIKPWLRGRDIRRWRADQSDLYVIAIASSANTPWPWSSERTETDAAVIFKETYPSIYHHLSRFENKLRKRQDKGRFFWELRACAYYQAFDRPKIVYADIGKQMRALLDRKDHLTGNTCYIIPGDDAYLLALLNSRLLDFYFRLAMPCLDDPFNGGDMRFFSVDMERVPIAQAKLTVKRRLSSLANEIQTTKESDPGTDTSSLERQLNEIVNEIYGLDKKDIALIKGAVPS